MRYREWAINVAEIFEIMAEFETPDKVFLITVDALRYDVVENSDIDTPNMEKLKEKGLSFKRAYANGCATAEAFPGILYSEKFSNSDGAPESQSIADYLKSAGYETIGFTSNPHTSAYNGYDKGFEKFYDYVLTGDEKEENSLFYKIGKKLVRSFEPLYSFVTKVRTEKSIPYERANTLNKDLFEELSEGKQFFWLHYMDTHAPYSPPNKFGEKYAPDSFEERGRLANVFRSGEISKEDGNKMRDLYLAEARYLDNKLGDLIGKAESLEDDVLIVFTSDHGEGFGERGEYKHSHYFEFNIRVPLIFYQPSRDFEEDEKLASHLDLLPTISSICGFEPPESFSGIDLLEKSRSEITIQKNNVYVVITEDKKLLERGEEKYLFELPDEIESDNFYDQKPEIVQNLRKKLESPVEEDIDF